MSCIKRFDSCKFVNYTSSDDVQLFEIGHHDCDPSYSYGPVVRNRYILHFVTSGRGMLRLGNREYQISAHQMFLIPSNALAFYQANDETPWSYKWLHIDGPKTIDFLNDLGLSITCPVLSLRENVAEIEQLLSDMLASSRREYYCIGKLYELFDLLAPSALSGIDASSPNKLNYVRTMIHYIQLKYCECIRVDDIANACGLDRSYASRLFKDATGSTLHDYLMTYRMKAACKQLAESDDPIQMIAYAVGYQDVFTFSKAFKKLKHISPSEYRAQLEKES